MKGIVYKISNTINDKVYIGKTYSSAETRFKQHINDSKKERCEKRPLYNAMNKHGVDKFYVEELGKFENAEEMEIYFISEYNSYKNGYNATLGGDGTSYVSASDNEIIEKYNELKNVKDTASYFGHCVKTIRKILNSNNIEIIRHFNGPKVFCNELDIEFDNILKAVDYFIRNGLSGTTNKDNVRRGINRVLDGSRRTYCGYTFKIISPTETMLN